MSNHLSPIWSDPLWQELWPHGISEVSIAHRDEFHPVQSTGPGSQPWKPYVDALSPYMVPDDPMDVAFGFGAVVIVIGGVAYFGTPAAAVVFVLEPGTLTITFFLGVMISNFLQERF